jgi:cell division septation protein DedD
VHSDLSMELDVAADRHLLRAAKSEEKYQVLRSTREAKASSYFFLSAFKSAEHAAAAVATLRSRQYQVARSP